ncbi:Quinate repressor protein [Pleurostoma richardsiae]|uniref:Quinate repressor protein n=1 Tax=Pleurostoma richardsiae TaxID=41990 RepID=A0AA38RIQ6_9PEZI|nr:Quinate repressor protein [Pleurostoma richardsiae]
MSAAPQNRRAFHQDASIILVGCRGAGKRSLGFIGALHLRRRLITEDHYFQQVTGLSRVTFLAKHGKDAFARKNAEVFRRMLEDNQRKCIIECGMSSFSEDAQEVLRKYSRTNPVVYVHRENDEVLRLLDSPDGERILRADESHRSCSNLEYYNLYDPSSANRSDAGPNWDNHLLATPSSLIHAKEDFVRFLDLITGHALSRTFLESPFSVRAIPPEYRQYSYAMRLRLSYLVDMDLTWEDFEARADCIELIIDHWPNDLYNVIARQVALIRRHLGVPVIYHVEENPRGERRRSAEERAKMDTELLELGLRLGVDYLSLDLQRTNISVKDILAHRGRSKIIGNFWNLKFGAIPWADDSQLNNYRHAQALGCDIVRMVRFCSGDSPNEKLLEFREKVERTIPDPKPPLVAYDISVLGIRTPLQGRILNPVKHPDIENERDHLATVCTANNSFMLLFRQFELHPLNFFVFGANVSYSLSPAMHNAAYEFAGMPHTFQAVQCTTMDELNKICSDNSFGGASLTAPFKVAIMPHLKLKSHHASVIGAVNVLLPLRGKTSLIIDHANSRNKSGPTNEFYGDNTDWSSILTCLRRAISPRNYVQPTRTTALVVGAGGMARAAIYALIQLGCRNIFIYNRTIQNAQTVADHFNSWTASQGISPAGKQQNGALQVCHVVTSITQPWPAGYQQPTIIVSCVPATSSDGSPPADFEVPIQWLRSPTGGVVVELAYEPHVTPLMAQMQTYRETVAPLWVVVDGLDNLAEMAVEAFELMTGRLAPKRLMREVCRKTWEQQRRDMSSMS